MSLIQIDFDFGRLTQAVPGVFVTTAAYSRFE